MSSDPPPFLSSIGSIASGVGSFTLNTLDAADKLAFTAVMAPINATGTVLQATGEIGGTVLQETGNVTNTILQATGNMGGTVLQATGLLPEEPAAPSQKPSPLAGKEGWAKVRVAVRAMIIANRMATQAAEEAEANAADAQRRLRKEEIALSMAAAQYKSRPNDSTAAKREETARLRVLDASAAARQLTSIATSAVSTSAKYTGRLMEAISTSALLANKSLAFDVFSAIVPTLISPSLRTALGQILLDKSQPMAKALASAVHDLYELRVERPHAEERRVLDAKLGTNHTADYDVPSVVIPTLSLRVHRPVGPPELEEVFPPSFFAVEPSGDPEQAPPSSLNRKGSTVGGLNAEKLLVDRRKSAATDDIGGSSSSSSSSSTQPLQGHPEPLTWPAGWNDPDEVVVVDMLFDLGVRFNWDEDPVFFAVVPKGVCCLPGGRIGVMACVMRARVRAWWHVRHQKVKLAILGGRDDIHFRSFAELSLCGSQKMPDLPGATSMVMRELLGTFTPEEPLEIDLAAGSVTAS